MCMPCVVLEVAEMDSNPIQSCSAGSAKDNPITIEDDSECESPVKISKRAEYYQEVNLHTFTSVPRYPVRPEWSASFR